MTYPTVDTVDPVAYGTLTVGQDDNQGGPGTTLGAAKPERGQDERTTYTAEPSRPGVEPSSHRRKGTGRHRARQTGAADGTIAEFGEIIPILIVASEPNRDIGVRRAHDLKEPKDIRREQDE